MKSPSIVDFIFQSQVKSLYRKFLKVAYKIPQVSTRNETISFYKQEFSMLTTAQESKSRIGYLRNSISSLAEMINRSGISSKPRTK